MQKKCITCDKEKKNHTLIHSVFGPNTSVKSTYLETELNLFMWIRTLYFCNYKVINLHGLQNKAQKKPYIVKSSPKQTRIKLYLKRISSNKKVTTDHSNFCFLWESRFYHFF